MSKGAIERGYKKKMKNKFLKLEVDVEQGNIQVLDCRTGISWKGFSLLQAVYQDGYRCPVNISFTKEAGWEVRSCEKNDTMSAPSKVL